jgi:hypothetical protein
LRVLKTTLQTSLLALAAMTCACQPPGQVPTAPPPDPKPRMDQPKKLVQRGPAIMAPSDAPRQLQVDLYQLLVPYGTISRNAQFWKRVDEDAINVTNYDLLYKNGVRVGQAPISEWDYFRQVMEEHPAVTKANTLVGQEGKPVELPLRKEVRAQDIFYFDADSKLQGRSFDQSENVITLTMQSAPRKSETLRLALCPVVRGTRRRLEYSIMNNELGEVSYAHPERLYDVNLRVDVPTDHFLVVAPSGDASWPTSIGNTFFITEGVAEKMETVLLIVPKPIHLVQTPAAQR